MKNIYLKSPDIQTNRPSLYLHTFWSRNFDITGHFSHTFYGHWHEINSISVPYEKLFINMLIAIDVYL